MKKKKTAMLEEKEEMNLVREKGKQRGRKKTGAQKE